MKKPAETISPNLSTATAPWDGGKRLTRRTALLALGYASAAAVLPQALIACGGGGARSGGPSGDPDTPGPGTLGTTLQIDRSEIGGTSFTARACWADGTDSCAISASSDKVEVHIHDDRAHAVSVLDGSGRMAALAVANPSQARGGSSIRCDASSTAEALIFAVPGILSCDPQEASARLAAIRSLPSFSAFVADIRTSKGIAEGLSSRGTSLAQQCVAEFLGSRQRSRGSEETFVFAEWDGGTGRVKLKNYGWRVVSVHCAYVDGGEARTGRVDQVTQVLSGGVTAGWGSLFTLSAGQPTEQTVDFNLSGHNGATTVEYWIQGPGVASRSVGLPADVPKLQSPIVWSALFYLVLPLIDFFGATTAGLQALKNPNLFAGVFAGASEVFSSGQDAQRAIESGYVGATIAALIKVLSGILDVLGAILERLGIEGLLKTFLSFQIPLAAATMGAFNLGAAIAAWVSLAATHHVDLNVPYRHDVRKVDEEKGDPAYDWTHLENGIEVPFGEYRTQIHVGDKQGPSKVKAAKDFGDVPVYRVHVMQKMNNSVSVPQGTVVGVVRALFADGGSVEKQLVAGTNTAEWAWEREDKLGRTPRHSLPATDFPQRANDAAVPGGSYGIKHFYVGLGTVGSDGPRRLRSLELEMFPAGLPSNFGIDIYGVTIDAAQA